MFVVLASAAFYHVGSAPVLVREPMDGARTSGRDDALLFKQNQRFGTCALIASVLQPLARGSEDPIKFD